jgi:outer membrane protein, heavy metal efflux system
VTVQQYKAEILPRAEQAYQSYQTSYQQMAAAYPQVLIAQRTLFQLEGDYVAALENAWQSALLIRGFGLRDGLAEASDRSPRPIQ